MKKTCNGCKALRELPSGKMTDNRGIYYCSLNFDMDCINKKPNVECPKPMTYSQLLTL